ncbi:hypothetical protein [uncultured Brachyspira sp.]|uniref:hypothetical protein n=1 Tax=uncultured Brachyspira sp. TaxID=221953 RepID=UPI0025864BB2|nr:hypothetical protein [uncultured Brachyspira sp.]
MLTCLGVISIDNMDIEDISYNDNYTEYIDLKSDIELAKKKLNIKNILNTYDAIRIANYINEMENMNEKRDDM